MKFFIDNVKKFQVLNTQVNKALWKKKIEANIFIVVDNFTPNNTLILSFLLLQNSFTNNE